jgi:formate/nitrite transporter FocA (FNT family)
MPAIDTTADADEQREALRLWVARAKVAGAVIGFAVATLVARRAGLDWVDAGLRGLLAAAVFTLVGWLCALLVINALMRTVAIQRRDEERRLVEERKAARAREAAEAAEPAEPVEAVDS